jgi:cytohesin
VDADFKDNDGRSPLQYAARNGHLEVIQALVDSGRVDISSQDKEHFTAVIQASKHHHTAILEYFIERYPDGFKAHDVDGTNVLGFAFIDKSPRQLATIKLLVDSKLVDLNERDTGGEKPMFKAATHNYVEGARYLMENGADVNAIEKNGKTPLHAVAGETFDYEMVKALVNHGANVNATDKENETPLHKVARYTPPQPLAGKPPPHPVTSGNPPNSTPSREVPSSEADKDTNKITKKTTRRNPDRSSTLEIVEFLIQHAANVNAINRQGMTPLHLAAGDGRSFEIVKFLLDNAKADPTIKNKDGEDPLMYAKAKGQSLGSSAIIAAIEQKQEALRKRQQKSKKGKKR